jgi:hypothetical protein
VVGFRGVTEQYVLRGKGLPIIRTAWAEFGPPLICLYQVKLRHSLEARVVICGQVRCCFVKTWRGQPGEQ